MARSSRDTVHPERFCVACGRRMLWRAKWAKNWDSVKFCSDSCRRRGVTSVDRALEASIAALVADASSGGLVSPTDAARAVGGEQWRELYEPARRAARRMVNSGDVEIVQKGAVVDPSTARGEIWVRSIRGSGTTR